MKTLQQLCLYNCSHIAVFHCKINSFKVQNTKILKKLTLWKRKLSVLATQMDYYCLSGRLQAMKKK